MLGHIYGFKAFLFFKILSYLLILQEGNFIKVNDFKKTKESYILFLENDGKIIVPIERVEAIVEDEISKEEFLNPEPELKLKPYKEFYNIKVPYGSLIAKISRKYNLNPLLLYCIMEVESNGNPYAISKKGAEGLMQLMPSTAKRFKVKNTFNPEDNIEGAAKYLSYLNELFEEKLELVLSGYICGENCVKKFNGVPAFKEVKDYLNRIFERYKKILENSSYRLNN